MGKNGGNGMRKRLVIGMLCLSLIPVLVALLKTEANAQTCARPPCVLTTIGASKCCTCPKTGSEIFDLSLWGWGKLAKECGSSDCLSCTVFGTVPSTAQGAGECTPSTLDSDCAIDGVVFCMNPAFNSDTAQGQPFTLDAVLTETGDLGTCTPKGRCTTSIPVESDTVPDDICINA